MPALPYPAGARSTRTPSSRPRARRSRPWAASACACTSGPASPWRAHPPAHAREGSTGRLSVRGAKQIRHLGRIWSKQSGASPSRIVRILDASEMKRRRAGGFFREGRPSGPRGPQRVGTPVAGGPPWSRARPPGARASSEARWDERTTNGGQSQSVLCLLYKQ